MPKLSVIMGTYNCKNQDWLDRSIQSICRQTFTDWELLICNDGSTNETQTWLEKWAQYDCRIKLLNNKKNCGLADSLNNCLSVAQGEYIARQDDDDISEVTRFQRQIDYLRTHTECDLVGTCAKVIDEQGLVQGRYLCEAKPTKRSFLWTNPFAHPTIMMRTEVLRHLGGYWNVPITRRCEDYDLFMRMYAEGFRGENIQDELYQYRVINDEKKKYRSMSDRLDEAKVRFRGYCALKLMPIGMLYVVKPVLIGMIPAKTYSRIVKWKYER